MSESNLKLHDTVPLGVKTADLAIHLFEGKPLSNVLDGDFSGSKAEPPATKRQCREIEQTGNNDYDEDSDDDGEGEAELLNEFSIMEYFEPYRIETVNFESDCEDAPECPTVDSDAENAVSRSIPGNDLGFKELNDINIVKKRKCTASYNTVKNKVLKVKGEEYTRSNGKKVPARRVKSACFCAKRQCHTKVTQEIQEQLLKNFLMLTFSAQNQFLSNHMTISPVKYHRVRV
ncbi:uncharacterized protein LOC115261675 [Aedes albopictus]|uniref:Secreted protein n=1 Tax=Aedes albopictus TaxID=7160 RepID=A0ABM1ZAI6_AEDAL